MNRDRARFRLWDQPLALSIVAGILLGASYPPIDAAILQIPAFLMLFRLCSMAVNLRETVLNLLPALLIWNFAVAHWLLMASLLGGFTVNLANALFMLLPFLLIRSLNRADVNPVLSAFTIAAVWCTFELFHHHWEVAYPWLTLGNGWANLTGATQYVSVTGILGISFWVVFTSALLYRFILDPVRPLLWSATLIFFSFPLFSVLATITSQMDRGDAIEVAVVQPDIDSELQHGGYETIEELSRDLLRRTAEIITPQTSLIFWPENALDMGLKADHPVFTEIRDSLREWNSELITGSGYIDYYDDSDRIPAVHRRDMDDRPFNIYNSAIHLDGESGVRSVYRKSKLVPFYERIPYASAWQTLDIFSFTDWGAISGYGRGSEPIPFETEIATIPLLICYDSVFPEWTNRLANQGQGFMAIITNDGWWGESSGHKQHFAYARLRAIEQRMWVVRAANNGISGIISPDGKVQYATTFGTDDAFRFTIFTTDRQTFFSSYGHLIHYLLVFFASIGSLFILTKKGRKP
ncbi:MAG: apolipoprotein N-acyltransferase [Balneolaceae bacterium]|nr:apolipoprotein N-acyltransferase [Balneolaceae bacterium]MCH8548494.1 apolipoprotein N-acyltransferase [Balneolaceae bacterium]